MARALSRTRRNVLAVWVVVGGVAAVLSGGSGIAHADTLKGDRDLLLLVADAFEANKERLSTWQGEVQITEGTEGGASRPPTKSRAEFVVDRESDSMLWRWHAAALKTPEGSRPAYYGAGMVKGSAIYRFGPFRGTGPDGPAIVNKVPRPDTPTPIAGWGGEFNPMVYFNEMSYDTPKTLRWYHRNADHPKLIGGSVRREGDLVILEIGDDSVTTQHVFDLSKGGNRVSFHAKDSVVEEQWSVDYEKVGDVFVPVTATYKNSRSDGDVRLAVAVRFEKNLVNTPLAPRTFDLGQLGVRPGDTVVDASVGLSFAYRPELADLNQVGETVPQDIGLTVEETVTDGGGEAVSHSMARDEEKSRPDVSGASSPLGDTARTRGRGFWLICAACAVLAAGVFVVVLRRRAQVRQ
ncbi:MAG: hypothetical protein JXL80_16970 [Planctomycetes bacterium]|nr:hypothetical protein [Planctomycetota bacterium]